MRLFLLFLATLGAARADPLDQLRATLRGLQGGEPLKADVSFDYWSRRGDDAAPVVERATVRAVAEDGPSGLSILWPHELVERLSEESHAKNSNPDATTPTRTALTQLSALRLSECMSGADQLLSLLEFATLTREAPSTWKGRPARQLELRLSPPISTHDRKFVKEVTASATLWIGPDGVPLAEKTSIDIKGRALLVISFEEERSEEREYVRTGGRMTVERYALHSRSSGAGENFEERSTLGLDLRGS
jgi:hypothetical protein